MLTSLLKLNFSVVDYNYGLKFLITLNKKVMKFENLKSEKFQISESEQSKITGGRFPSISYSGETHDTDLGNGGGCSSDFEITDSCIVWN